jgi:hypothetical protein
MYKTKKNDQGQIELWWDGPSVKNLLGVYESMEELEKAREQVRKQEERGQFLRHTYKDGKRHHDVVKGPEED